MRAAPATLAPPTNALSAPLCPSCGYDLRGLSSARCPECGLPIDRATESAIPWVRRREIGRARAFGRTALMATLRPRRLFAEVARPVSHRDGQTFRVAVVALACVPLAAVATWVVSEGPNQAGRPPTQVVPWLARSLGVPEVARWASDTIDVRAPLLAGLATPGVAAVGVLVAVALASGVPSYGFHPRRLPVARQNRAIAASYFALAPLLLLAVTAVASAALYGSAVRYPAERNFGIPPEVGTAAGWVARATAVAALLGWWATLAVATSVTTIAGPLTSTARVGVAVLVAVVVAAVTPAAIAWTVGYVRLMLAPFF